MNTKIALALCVTIAVIGAVSVGSLSSAHGQDDHRNDKNAEALKKAKIAYAEALLKVAQADLNKSREANARIPETIPRAQLRQLESDVAMARARLQGVLGTSKENENPYVAAAKISLAFAEESVQEAKSANARAPGAVSAGEVERRQADVELAKAKLEVAKLLEGADPLEVTRWELLQLQENVHDLRYRVRLLQYRN